MRPLRFIGARCKAATMTSADFLVHRSTEPNPRSPRVRACSFLQLLRHLLNEGYPKRKTFGFGQGRYKDVLAYPPQIASVCRSCSSVPDFAVSLPSDLRSPAAPLRLANRLHQLACKGLTPSGIFKELRIFRYGFCPCRAHTNCKKHKNVFCKVPLPAIR